MINFIISFILGVLSAFVYEFIARTIGINVFRKESLVIIGYKLHHSLYGLLSFILFGITQKSFFFGFGLGIIFQHAVTDGFFFVNKV